MIVKYGNTIINCDSATETDGMLSIYQGGLMIMQIANIPDLSIFETEDGEIEHILNPLEQALQDKDTLQTMLNENAAVLAEKIQELSEKEAIIETIRDAVSNIGTIPTLSTLTTFLAAVKAALGDANGSNSL